jgi:AcrR family transcriptional regulator
MAVERDRERDVSGHAISDTFEDIDGRSTRWDAHNARRRDQLIDAAIAAVEADGPGVGVGRIAERAGVRRPVFYRHFKDRDELDEQIRLRVLATLMTQLLPHLVLTEPPVITLGAVIQSYLDWVIAHPRLHQLLDAGAPGPHVARGEEVAAAKNELITAISNFFGLIIDLHAPDARFRVVVASGLVGFADAVVSRWMRDQDPAVSASDLATFLTNTLWMIIDGNLRAAGVVLDPTQPLTQTIWPELST